MLTRPRHGPQAIPVGVMLLAAALLVSGCIGLRGQQSSSPSVSAPGATPTVAPTLPPGETPQVTATPEPGVTAPPTDEPTDSAHPNWPAGAISARDAGDHAGEQATVCGTVDTVRWIFDVTGHPTWLNFNRPYPNMRFNGVIWGEQRRAWPLGGKPEDVYPGREVCVTGLVEGYTGWSQIQNLTISDVQVLP